MDSGKTWEQVNEILRVLKIACKFLDFPADSRVRRLLVEGTENGGDSQRDAEANEHSEASAGGDKKEHSTIGVKPLDQSPAGQSQRDGADEVEATDLAAAEVSETEATAA